MRTLLVIAGLVVGLSAGCAKQPRVATPQASSPASNESNSQMKLMSSAFKDGEAIPRGYTCDGANVSPPLEWANAPKSVKTFALVVDDPDAPAGTWVHWVLYNLPGDTIGMTESTPLNPTLADGAMQGTNDFKKIGYGGPCPPSGTHRYFFKLYALDANLSLNPGATKADLEKSMEGHILSQAQLIGTYRR